MKHTPLKELEANGMIGKFYSRAEVDNALKGLKQELEEMNAPFSKEYKKHFNKLIDKWLGTKEGEKE